MGDKSERVVDFNSKLFAWTLTFALSVTYYITKNILGFSYKFIYIL